MLPASYPAGGSLMLKYQTDSGGKTFDDFTIQTHMRARWARAFLWSTLGGAAVGVAAVLAGSRRRSAAPVLRCQRIPDGCSRVVIWTRGFQIEAPDGLQTVHDTYVLQMTSFKAWSVMDLPSGPGEGRTEGSDIYHITHIRTHDGAETVLDRFYATIDLIDAHGKSCGRSRLARGGVLQVRECLVGGAANGIETGNARLSAAPVLNFRFEYSPADERLHEPPARAS
jgi:hypothetical protein